MLLISMETRKMSHDFILSLSVYGNPTFCTLQVKFYLAAVMSQ